MIIIIFLHSVLTTCRFLFLSGSSVCWRQFLHVVVSRRKKVSRARNIMFDCFNITYGGNYLLRGLCVRDTECPEGNTAKSNILVSFSINFMAFLLHLPKRQRKWEIHSNVVRLKCQLPLCFLPFQPVHPSLPPFFYIFLSSAPPFNLCFSLPPSLHNKSIPFYLTPPSVFSHAPALSWLMLPSLFSVSILDHKELKAWTDQ